MAYNRRKPNAVSWAVTLAILGYCVYGLLNKGIYFPSRHHSEGMVMTGASAWVATGGILLISIHQTICAFLLPPDSDSSTIPTAIKVFNWAGFLCMVAAGFMAASAKSH